MPLEGDQEDQGEEWVNLHGHGTPSYQPSRHPSTPGNFSSPFHYLPSVLLPFSTTPSAGLNDMPKQFTCPSSQSLPSSSQPLVQLLPQQTLDQSKDKAFHQEVHPLMASFWPFPPLH
jgi:hypothetical protein